MARMMFVIGTPTHTTWLDYSRMWNRDIFQEIFCIDLTQGKACIDVCYSNIPYLILYIDYRSNLSHIKLDQVGM